MEEIEDEYKSAVEYIEDGKVTCRTYSKEDTPYVGMRVPAKVDVLMNLESAVKLDEILQITEKIRSASQLVEVHFVLDTTNQIPSGVQSNCAQSDDFGN